MEAARRATLGDLPRLAELCRAALAELGARERGGRLYVVREGRPQPVEETLGREVGDGRCLVLVGTVDGTIMGYCTGRTEPLRDGRRLGLLDELFVEEGARGVGVGEAMMDEALAWFREQRCAGVDSTALPGARETKNFFEESGFTARLLVMHRSLEE
ncbi:MAG: GNAT family N-acetyltransferase [Actinomycetota bacterium]|nr:GNAT family N-acetyltransferase [Actinomycetota bacterium]